MNANSTLDRPRRAAKRGILAHFFAVVLAFAALFGASTPARAVDGCKVLLCLDPRVRADDQPAAPRLGSR